MNVSYNSTITIENDNFEDSGEEIEYFDDDINVNKIRIGRHLYKYAAYIYFILGVSFNVISIMVFSRKSLRSTLSASLFRILALMDLIYIITNIFPGIVDDLQGKETVNAMQCRVFMILSVMAKNMSACTLTLVTVERFIAVISPHTAKLICKPRRMYLVLFVVFWINLAIIMAGSWHMTAILIATKDRKYEFLACINESFTSKKQEFFQDKIWPYLDFLMYMFIPIAIMLPMDIGIIMTLAKANRMRSSMAGSNPGGGASGTTNVTSMTGMLLSVCFAFMVFAIPDALAFFHPMLVRPILQYPYAGA